ncbi:MAG TPA: nicotinate phosphoribosyltransferase [Burkholderiales bacterium]|nr:nicotinate phosphoribosyltransferase [Burkholderiales bacterium]
MSQSHAALLTDFYQLTMAQAYFALGMRETAVFELFARRLPRTRRFLLAAGLEQIVEYLEEFRFTSSDIEFLAGLDTFPTAFLEHLTTVRFTGSLHAMAEGTPFFANEPILRVTAPILEAQLVESRVLNLAHFQTLIASKAARCVLAARGRRLVDFGMRRAHGAEAAIHASRAAFLAGFDATATVEAGRRFGIPLSGTMAHSFVEAHDREEEALRNFVAARGRRTALLIDTYDTERAARRVVELARELTQSGAAGGVRGVRIDSGDLAAQALAVRRILNAGQCGDVEIILSGSLDEYRIESLLEVDTPVDAFGIGTHLDVSEDAPALDMAYKLQEYAGQARRKRSPGKATWPGRKQVFRERNASGELIGDSIGLADEALNGEPLLREIMREGRRTAPMPALSEIRDSCREKLLELPAALRVLRPGEDGYPVRVSDRVQALTRAIDAQDTAEGYLQTSDGKARPGFSP